MSASLPFSEVTRLDAELVRLARGASALRLTVGDALERLASSGGHHELGFSSLEAYALERCERTGRWAADSRSLARRLARLPRIRAGLRAGVIGWSTAELLARHVTPESEAEWLEKARGTTVRELEVLLASTGATVEDDGSVGAETRTLTVTVAREDGWLFECARKVVQAVAGRVSSDRLLEHLLAEGYGTLLDLVPESERSALYEIERLESDVVAESKANAVWCGMRSRWRSEAEELCERHLSSLGEVAPRETGETEDAIRASPQSPESLDCEIQRICAELDQRDLALGIVAESARKAEVWQRLGFATEAQYARERVGISLSSLKAKRILATRTACVPELAEALARGRVGYEAAYVLSRIVTPATVADWIRRAEERTVKHLREEVEAAEILIRMSGRRDQPPLDEARIEELFELERSIVSGDLVDGEARGGAGQISGGRRRRATRVGLALGRITFRWTATEQTYRFWRSLECVFRRVRRAATSFLGFLCGNLCRIWLPALRRQRFTDSGVEPEYYGVYRRDAFRCSSPVCTRRDVTPHHLVFRSHGGGDEDENLATLCVWCHLRGVHEGRIAADPPASRIGWRIGRSGTLRVEGRTRLAAAIYS